MSRLPTRDVANPFAGSSCGSRANRVRSALLLTRKFTNRTSRRLIEEFARRGVAMEPVDPFECALHVSADGPRVVRAGRDVSADLVMPRFGPGLTEFGLSLLRQFERSGVRALNDSLAIARARDKFRCLQILAECGVPVPMTLMTRESEVKPALETLPGEGCVVKVLQGSQGTGVLRFHDRERAARFLLTTGRMKQNLLVQEFVDAKRDLRVVVAGGRCVAAMARATDGDFRANLHLGGVGTPLAISPSLDALARRATVAVGLDVAGVDLIESERGLLVLEVNPSPGIEGIEAVTGSNVAGAVADFALAPAAADDASANERS